MKMSVSGFLVIIQLLICCSPFENVVPVPAIVISSEVQQGTTTLHGYITGVEPALYHLAIYGKINDNWFNLWDQNGVNILISKDFYWLCEPNIDLQKVTEIELYLLPRTINPPLVDGKKMLPVKLSLMSVATISIHFAES